MATMIKGKSLKEVRLFLGESDDLTKKEHDTDSSQSEYNSFTYHIANASLFGQLATKPSPNKQTPLNYRPCAASPL